MGGAAEAAWFLLFLAVENLDRNLQKKEKKGGAVLGILLNLQAGPVEKNLQHNPRPSRYREHPA